MRLFKALPATLLFACAPAASGPSANLEPPSMADVGILVMAHGGTGAWDAAVREAVAPLAEEVPMEIAFGMANRHTLEAGLNRLHEQGVERVAVVRLFLSGASFLDQTLYYLGLSSTMPEPFLLMGPGASDADARSPIEHSLEVATHSEGLLVSSEAQDILDDRVGELALDPASESVLFIAHGMGDESENQKVLDAMSAAAEGARKRGFEHVRVATLREDWAEERAAAEASIRGFVQRESSHRHRVLVVPARLFGFGPYAEVLAHEEYVEGAGLLPHPDIGSWVRNTAARAACSAGWGSAIGDCAVVAHEP